MSSILYYSNYCQHSKQILQELSRHKVKDEIHFVCIDRRYRKSNEMYVILDNGIELLVPNVIKRVPSLLLLTRGNMVLEGNQQIFNHLREKVQEMEYKATEGNGEPLAYSFSSGASMPALNNVMSDNFSFLDQSPDEMAAKGNGGLRQLYNYSLIEGNGQTIETPPENYTPNKVGNISLDDIRAMRERDVPSQQPRM
jgi:phage-related protein